MLTELSNREQQVVRLVARGLSNRKIASALDLVEGTVKIHLHNVYKKLRVANRVALVVKVPKRKQKARSARRTKYHHFTKSRHWTGVQSSAAGAAARRYWLRCAAFSRLIRNAEELN
jgi:DNA-binding CsgD family transcriptional regulator